jgi:hypothetical protein
VSSGDGGGVGSTPAAASVAVAAASASPATTVSAGGWLMSAQQQQQQVNHGTTEPMSNITAAAAAVAGEGTDAGGEGEGGGGGVSSRPSPSGVTISFGRFAPLMAAGFMSPGVTGVTGPVASQAGSGFTFSAAVSQVGVFICASAYRAVTKWSRALLPSATLRFLARLPYERFRIGVEL